MLLIIPIIIGIFIGLALSVLSGKLNEGPEFVIAGLVGALLLRTLSYISSSGPNSLPVSLAGIIYSAIGAVLFVAIMQLFLPVRHHN